MISADRIDIKWRPPLDPKVHGYGTRIDSGGYIYRVFRDGRLTNSGSSDASLDRTIDHTKRLAAAKGLIEPQVRVLSTAP